MDSATRCPYVSWCWCEVDKGAAAYGVFIAGGM